MLSCLGSTEKPPFYAVRVYPSAVGTKGGIAIDINGHALGNDGTAIDGLFAAGNVADRIFGPFTIGNGVTIASAATIGFRVASCAADKSLSFELPETSTTPSKQS